MYGLRNPIIKLQQFIAIACCSLYPRDDKEAKTKKRKQKRENKKECKITSNLRRSFNCSKRKRNEIYMDSRIYVGNPDNERFNQATKEAINSHSTIIAKHNKISQNVNLNRNKQFSHQKYSNTEEFFKSH